MSRYFGKLKGKVSDIKQDIKETIPKSSSNNLNLIYEEDDSLNLQSTIVHKSIVKFYQENNKPLPQWLFESVVGPDQNSVGAITYTNNHNHNHNNNHNDSSNGLTPRPQKKTTMVKPVSHSHTNNTTVNHTVNKNKITNTNTNTNTNTKSQDTQNQHNVRRFNGSTTSNQLVNPRLQNKLQPQPQPQPQTTTSTPTPSRFRLSPQKQHTQQFQQPISQQTEQLSNINKRPSRFGNLNSNTTTTTTATTPTPTPTNFNSVPSTSTSTPTSSSSSSSSTNTATVRRFGVNKWR